MRLCEGVVTHPESFNPRYRRGTHDCIALAEPGSDLCAAHESLDRPRCDLPHRTPMLTMSNVYPFPVVVERSAEPVLQVML